MRSVVVTGTSTGIGWGIAKVLTAKGQRVLGSAQRRRFSAHHRGLSQGPFQRCLGRFFEVFALRVVFRFTDFFFTAVGFLLGFLARVLAAPFL
jgi:NAD(P)-dependent dehydrogenase (short-subunit alcohol dehydrogenase family)